MSLNKNTTIAIDTNGINLSSNSNATICSNNINIVSSGTTIAQTIPNNTTIVAANYIASGAFIMAGATGVGYSGSWGFTTNELKDEESSIGFEYINTIDLKIKGNLRSCALLILNKIKEMEQSATYSYGSETYKPKSMSWGPFDFALPEYTITIKENTKVRLVYENINSSNTNPSNDKNKSSYNIKPLLKEFKDILKIKAFW